MCEKMKQVNTWLGSVFGEQPVPQFEVNTRTVELLHQLARASEARCRDSVLLLEDRRQKTAEYLAQASHLQDVLLQAVDVSCSSVSRPTADYVSGLVDVAMVMSVRDTSLSSFLPAVNGLTSDLSEAERRNRRLERELAALRRRLGATLLLRGNLQEDVDKTARTQAVEGAKAEERLLNMDFVTAKARELSHRQERSEVQLGSRNMDKSVTHQALVQLSQEVDALKKEITPLKKKLEPYMDLSPNPSLAQVKVEEAKRELAALDQRLEGNVDFK
ncbi:HAUS augmin-like complex subunit 1 [Cololabis saira]|uniref:HAUS augmin-like complex subunit 1 n=1 Tax=Cololabis saira TaxID=129043 RepID=UPI002AD25136|nr:HAUS augmin-like complex subunit 1 [Cololabis saira]